ncbi:MAG: type II toxin-antitoxin system RelE/ParE family toxin [Deltaproteobacteria bacterium]|nr:type II toxin-antitoxin system RelE/ParE family toxin [Deltaproteobacteria bacterium]
MEKYKVVFRKSVFKDLERIPKKDVRRIVASIKTLAENPRPPQSRKLSGDEKYRLRSGVYRILYSIEDNKLIICVVKIRHRKNVYRKST